DAISTKDYYALFGILESSHYRLARFDTVTQHRQIAEDLAKFQRSRGRQLQEIFAGAVQPAIQSLDAYLLTAAGLQDRSKELDATLLARWRAAVGKAAKDESSPLFAFAGASANPKQAVRETLPTLLKRWPL